MEYKVIQFKQFLQENKLKVADLPEPIQEKIDIFYRLHALLETIQEPDFQELLEQVEQLDIEIQEDIEEEYEEHLTNNEHPSIVKRPENTPKKTIKGKSDVMIVEELVKMRRTTNIRRSKLIDMGIKTKLKGDTRIGNHLLKRTSFFYYRYNIIPLKGE